MARPESKLSVLPLGAALGVILALGLLLLGLAVRDLANLRLRLEEELFQKGLTLVRTMEAGTRSGMMAAGMGGDFVHRLLVEAAAEPDVNYLLLVGPSGTILADSRPDGGVLPPLPAGAGEGPRRRVVVERTASSLVIVKPFATGPARGFHRGRVPLSCDLPGGPLLEGSSVVVSMSLGGVQAGLRLGRQRAVLSGLLVLLAAVGGIILVGVAQRYASLHRSLTAARSYADRVVDSMGDGLLALDSGGVVTVANAGAARVLGHEEQRLRGMNIGELLPELAGETRGVLNEGRAVPEIALSLARDGREMRLAAGMAPIRDGRTVAGAVLVLRDVTELERLRERLREQDKLAALGGMAAAVAHEIRNPLSSIKGLAQLLGGRFTEGSADRRHTAVIVEEVERLNRFVEELLLYVRPRPPLLLAADLAEEIRGTVELIRGEAVKNDIRLDLDLPAKLPPALFDRDQVRRLVLNVLRNSIEALEKRGGNIEVTLRRSAGGGLGLTVADDGLGLPPGEEERVLDSFYSTKPGGTGLGLAIVRQVAAGHGWGFALAYRPGGGAVNTLTIPESALAGGEEEDRT